MSDRRPPAHRSHITLLSVGVVLAVVLFLGLLTLPVVSLVFRIPLAELLQRLRTPLVTQALRLSLVTSVVSTAVVMLLGAPLAYVLARRDFHGKRLLTVLIDLPMVLPPTVAGVGLLLAFGRTGLVGRVFAPWGVTIPFTSLAVVLAQMFVAGPFFINAARAGFEGIETRYLQAAATLRAPAGYTFFHVMLPLSFPALLAGAAMTWARALGEFGATITFAGNLPGHTQTMPLAVYVALQSDLEAAVALSVVLMVVSFALLLGLRGISRRTVLLR
jgi:molybdate transport system permease protein